MTEGGRRGRGRDGSAAAPGRRPRAEASGSWKRQGNSLPLSSRRNTALPTRWLSSLKPHFGLPTFWITDVPCFILLRSTALHRCVFLQVEGKTLHQQKDGLITAVWNHTGNPSGIRRYGVVHFVGETGRYRYSDGSGVCRCSARSGQSTREGRSRMGAPRCCVLSSTVLRN